MTSKMGMFEGIKSIKRLRYNNYSDIFNFYGHRLSGLNIFSKETFLTSFISKKYGI